MGGMEDPRKLTLQNKTGQAMTIRFLNVLSFMYNQKKEYCFNAKNLPSISSVRIRTDRNYYLS